MYSAETCCLRLESFTWHSWSFCQRCEAVRGPRASVSEGSWAQPQGRGWARRAQRARARPPRWECRRRRQQQGRFGPFPLPGIPDLISAVTPAGLAALPNPQLWPGAGSLRAPPCCAGLLPGPGAPLGTGRWGHGSRVASCGASGPAGAGDGTSR